MGTGGCAAFDVVLILKKSRQDISDCVVEIEAERAMQEPKVFTRIHFHFILTGKKLNPQQVERAINLSAEKYCSASIMLAKTAELTHDFEIVEMIRGLKEQLSQSNPICRFRHHFRSQLHHQLHGHRQIHAAM